jgi:small-conductance mechanosensitive channel
MATPITTVPTDGTISSGGGIDLSTIIPQILEKFLEVLEAAAVIIIGIFLIRYIRARLRKIETEHENQRNAINLFEKITSGFIVVISITIALKIVGIDMTLLVSVSILGLSYGLQDVIKNYVAGILILFKSPFQIGEVIKIRNFVGRVSKMDFQATTLETFDHRYITIYNSDVMTQSIINFSTMPVANPTSNLRRIDIDVMLGYGSDVNKALSIFEKIIAGTPVILKSPKYSVIFKKFSENAIVFTIKCWVQKPCNILKIRSAIAIQINQAFDEEKIFMPYSKDIQLETDYTMSAERKQRTQNFYGQPAFSEAAAQEVTPEDGPDQIDFEEPE